MHDSISTTGLQRPRVRRGLGVLVGAAVLVTPMAAAPAASAAGGLGNVTPGGVAATLGQLPEFLGNIGGALPGVLAQPLGGKAPNTVKTCTPGYADGISSTVTCVISALDNPGAAKAKAKVTTRKGKARSARWVK